MEFPLAPDQAAVGRDSVHVVQPGRLLMDVARDYNLGYVQFMAANQGVDPWLPKAGSTVRIPGFYLLPDGPRRGLVVNLAWHRMFYFPEDGGRVETYPLGVSVLGAETPLGTTKIVRKQQNPTWVPPPSIRAERPELPGVVRPGPDNPLGSAAFYLGWERVLIHGTNKPDGVGRTVSHGCLHLYPEDIDALFPRLPVGTPVTVIDEDAAVAWVGPRLYVQIYPTKEQSVEIEQTGKIQSHIPSFKLLQRVAAAAESQNARVDWTAVERAAYVRTGLPTLVATSPGSVNIASGARAKEPGFAK